MNIAPEISIMKHRKITRFINYADFGHFTYILQRIILRKILSMKILICLDYSSLSEKILEFSKNLAAELKTADVTVLHIVDETLFFTTTGFEVQLGETLHSENTELKEMCIEYLGDNVKYVEEMGIPRLKAEEMLTAIDHDMILIGSYSRHSLAGRLMGGFAEHIMSISKKPVLFVP